jgi:hypothetical protein
MQGVTMYLNEFEWVQCNADNSRKQEGDTTKGAWKEDDDRQGT